MRSLWAGIFLAGQLIGLAPVPAPAHPFAAPAACVRAAARAERRWGLPAHLLLAIGEVESGRPDPRTGRPAPWPWSVNVAGAGSVFGDARAAQAAVGAARAQGVASIDVGCFQVNLLYHPHAFASLAEGFDPDANGDYAGRFLRALFQRTGSWETAIADYHSADRGLGDDYRARVLQAWRALDGAARLPPADPYVILAAMPAGAIPVYTPATLPAALRAELGLPPLGPGRP